MFELLMALSPSYITALVVGCMVVVFMTRKALVDRKIRKLGGVRSPVLATNPITGLPFLIRTGYYQTRDKLDHFYNSIFDYATPECPNCVEISFLGRVRFLMTREPEHVKTILTTKFGEYGKGPQFHEIWSPFLGDSIFTTDDQLWADSRSLIRPMFIKDRVRDIEVFDKWANTLISKLPYLLPRPDFTFLRQASRGYHAAIAKVIRDQLMAVLIAGRDTTAATLSWAIYELAHCPRAYARLGDEVLATVGPARQPTYEDLKSMSYLTHTLNETLRLYPAVPYNLRAALQDTSLPGRPGQPDIAVLEGDVVVYSAMAMQRRRDLYPEVDAKGEKFADPAVFCPERWDAWTPKAWNYVPFNGGPRICVGQNFAMTEMALTLVRLLQKYRRLEYRGDWHAQFHKAEIVGAPGHGVPVAFFEAENGDLA
ncbi:Cytochrome P450 52A1 [Madurella mycetomatis]|uniref:Cytochrome P450 52A1 n=1 Tax=Madurella mycetomatis TaxID=100816 RepID=A0A175WGH5_9PEZI|nr:Cytochrome P450 52A1 [Madurella mycetomatis]